MSTTSHEITLGGYDFQTQETKLMSISEQFLLNPKTSHMLGAQVCIPLHCHSSAGIHKWDD